MHATKSYGGVKVYLHLFFRLASDDLSGQIQAPIALYPGKEPCVALNGRLGVSSSCSGRYGEETGCVYIGRLNEKLTTCRYY